MPNFDNMGKLTLRLKAQSPMIHFQARETGATVRASEVKPKLDRFLLRKLKESGVEPDKGMMLESNDGSPSKAFRYKMQIYCETPPQVVVINNDYQLTRNNPGYQRVAQYPIYYANSGNHDPEEQILGVISDPTVSIYCFHDRLRELISQYLEEFFLVTNFGTMQDKGFGSFAPENYTLLTSDQKRIVAGFLKQMCGTNRCWSMTCMSSSQDTLTERNRKAAELLKWVGRFSHLMKSGYNNNSNEYERSFLFQYMHRFQTADGQTGIGNEKAWMKRNGISPTSGTHRPVVQRADEERPRYVRALLGTAGNISYLKEDLQGRTTVTISNSELERVPSPIFFKVIGDTVFITAFPVDERVYGKPFNFSGKRPYTQGTIRTPEKSLFPGGRFDIESFLAEFVAHYNELIRNRRNPRGLNRFLEGAPSVEEVR